jgi:hypothetical protein
MTHPSTTLPDDNDWLDVALRETGRDHREEYLPDAGFTARVMGALPAPPTLPAWRKPVLALLWATAGVGLALALPGAVAETALETLRVLGEQRVSFTGIGAGLAALAVATWAGAAYALARD